MWFTVRASLTAAHLWRAASMARHFSPRVASNEHAALGIDTVHQLQLVRQACDLPAQPDLHRLNGC